MHWHRLRQLHQLHNAWNSWSKHHRHLPCFHLSGWGWWNGWYHRVEDGRLMEFFWPSSQRLLSIGLNECLPLVELPVLRAGCWIRIHWSSQKVCMTDIGCLFLDRSMVVPSHSLYRGKPSMRWRCTGFLYESFQPLDWQRLLELHKDKRRAHYLLSLAIFAE